MSIVMKALLEFGELEKRGETKPDRVGKGQNGVEPEQLSDNHIAHRTRHSQSTQASSASTKRARSPTRRLQGVAKEAKFAQRTSLLLQRVCQGVFGQLQQTKNCNHVIFSVVIKKKISSNLIENLDSEILEIISKCVNHKILFIFFQTFQESV